MSYIDELNAELGLGDETPTIGSPKLTEQTLETADLPEIQPAENPFAPPTEATPSTEPSVTTPPPSPSVAQTPSTSVQLPSTPSVTVPTAPVGQGSIYKTALTTLGQSTSAPENPVERANIELGFTKAPPLPYQMQENPIDKANRELGLPSSVPYGDTRDTQGPGQLMPSFYDTNVPTAVDKPQKGILTEAIHAPIYGAIQLGQVAAGLVAIAGDAFKSDAISNLARGIYDKTTKMMEPFAPSVGDIREIGGVSDAMHFAVSQIGQMLPFMIGTMGAGGAISKLMLRTLGPSIIEKATASALAKGLAEASVKDAVGKAMADLGITAGRAGMVTSSLGLSAGTIASDRMENGLKVLSSDLLWAIPGGLLYTLPEWRLADRFQLFGKAVSDTVKKEGIDAGRTMFIKEFGKQALLGGATMGWEAIINEAGAGRAPFTYDTMWKAINGFIGGGLASGVMGAGVGLLFKTPPLVGNEPVGEKLGPPSVPLVGQEFGANLIRPELADIGRRVFAPEQPALPPGQGFNLVNKPESVLRKAWNVPPESNPDIYTLQEEGRFRPVGQGPSEVMPGQVDINRYQDMLNPVKGEGFVTQPVRQVQAGPAEVMTRDAQNLANSAEWAPLREVWNKLVMGEENPPQLLWGGKFPEHLLYDERQGARGLQAPWVDTEITSAGHIVHTDFDGGKLESLFDKNMKPGKEFIPIRYTAPNGDSTILRRGEPLPQSLMDTIHTFIAVRNRALSEASGTAETPPPQLGAKPVPVTPPKVEGVEYVGVQGYKGLAPDQYMFNDLKTGSSFVTDNLSTEAIMRGRNRKRAEFQTLTPLVVELGQAMDQGLEYDLIANMRKGPPPAAPIEPVGGTAYSTGQEVTFKRGEKTITGTFNEMNSDGTLSVGNRPGEPTNMWEVKPEEVVTVKKRQVTAPAPIPVVPAAPERIPGFARHMVFRDDGHLSFRLGSVEEQVSHRMEGGRRSPGIIPGLIGEVWVDANTNEVYSMSMYDRKLKGEDIRGIPLDQLDGTPVEGWKNRVANIDSKFDISEKIGEPIGPIWYSQAERVVNEKMSGSMSSEQLGKMLRNAGVKADEMKWSGLDELLQKPKSYTRQEVLDYLKQNQVEVKEVVKGELKPGELTALPRGEFTKFSQWQLPGGENYRELLLTLPNEGAERQTVLRNKISTLDEAERQALDRMHQKPNETLEMEKEVKNIRQERMVAQNELAKQPTYPEPFRGAHWDEPNVLAHVRFNDRTVDGKKVLFIEEVQSDWHQAGREKGYVGQLPSGFTVSENPNFGKYSGEARWMVTDTEGQVFGSGETKTEALAEYGKENAQIPIAPFSKTWHEMAMRRMVRWAAENGYDRIAWTTGEQQAARYDLSKQIREVSVQKTDTGGYAIRYGDNSGRIHDIEGSIQPEKLPDYVGKDLATKIVNDIKGNYETKVYSGLDLKVGGEGMKGFYDKILPEYMNKLGKKWGAKAEEINLGTPDEAIGKLYGKRDQFREGTPEWENINDQIMHMEDQGGRESMMVHSMDITPSMKESVLQGQPLFRQGQRVPGMSKEAATQVVNDLNLKIPSGIVNFWVINSRDELPPEVASKLDHKPGKFTRGMYVRSEPVPTIYIFAKNSMNAAEVSATAFHELVGHLGFEKLVGPERIAPVTKMVHELYTKEELGYLYRRYGVEPNTKDGDYMVALEKIAEIAETGSNPGLWTKVKVWFKEIMAGIFGNDAVGKITEDEIKVYLWRSRELLQQTDPSSMAQVYNSMTKLISMRMWNMQLPDGPAGVGSFMREDSSPSHVDAAENLGGWRSWFQAHRDRQKNFGSGTLKDLGVLEAIFSLPHWVAMKLPGFKEVAGVQWDRQDKRNRDRIYLMQDPKSDTGDNPYIARKHTEGVDKVIIWSDQNNFYLQGDEQFQKKFQELNGRAPATEEIQAYHGWKQGFDRAADYAISKLRESAMKLYSDQPWYDQFKGVVDNTLDPATLRTTMDPEQFKDLQGAVTKTGERMSRIDEREADLKAMNFYAPHVRGKGEYVVRVFDTNAEGKQIRTWVERFENATDAEKARVRLAQDYKGLLVEKTFEPKTTEFVYGGLDVPAMESFLQSTMERAKGKFGIDEVAADKFMGTVLKAIDEEIMARGFRQQYIHRHQGNVIGGYRTEGLHQVFFDYMSGLSGSMTKLDATYDFHKALQNIDKVNERGLYEYATRYVKDMLRNSDAMDRKLGAFKTLPYAWYLAANLRLAATQMFQNGVTAYPILARLQQENGIKGSAALRLGKAMKDITEYSMGKRGAVSEVELKMLQDAYEQGETMANYIQEIKGKVEGGWAKTYFMKLMDVASIPFAGMERFNRRTSLLAAFRLFTEAGKPYDQAYESAKEFVRDAHYAYGLSNYPQLLRDGTPFSKIAGMAYVFKSFPHNYVLSMLHFAKDKDGKLALGVMMRSVAMLAALGGLGAVPFIDDLLEEYEQHFGDPVRSKIRTAIRKYGGDMLGQVGMEGLPALAGIDMSGSTKMQIPIPGVGEFDPSTFTMGVWGGLIDKGKKALDFASNSQWSRAIEAASPVGVEMMLQSARRSQEGLKTTGERPILDVTGKPIMPTPYETGAQVAGFRPERIAEIQKERRVSQNVEKHFTEQRQNLSKQLRMAQGDPAQMESVKRDIQTYNLRVMKYGGVIPRISPDSLLSGMKPETRYMKNERVEARQ